MYAVPDLFKRAMRVSRITWHKMEAIDHIDFEFMGDGTNIGKEIQHGITREVEQDDINTVLNKEILKAGVSKGFVM